MPVHTQRHGDRQSDRRRDKNRAEAGHHRRVRLTAVRPVAIRRGSRRVIIPHIAGLRRVAARRAAAYAEPTQPAIAPAGRAARWRTGRP